MQTLRKNKVDLISALTTDASYILQYVQQNEIITKREYSNLNHPNHTPENIVINLLDKVMNKGDTTCQKFVDLLKQKDIQETFPGLQEVFKPVATSHNQDNLIGAADEIDEYKMSSLPRGLCVIINNVIFSSSHKHRSGSDSDKDALKEVFQWLGFTVDVHENQSGDQMKKLLKTYSQKIHNGDCFICCILSHGSRDGVYGTDGAIVTRDDIFGPFSGTSCPSLISKPKVFFIQACRGEDPQPLVTAQSDSYNDEEMEVEAEMDVVEMATLPADSDFLIARSTVKGYISLRETISGSWFIQSLCQQLKMHCPKDEDVPNILLRVNNEVSQKAARVRGIGMAKQMPIHKVTLRKKLVFRVPQ
ncbi:caspase 20, apoptosis-related cysteine peptidase [Clarias gariepinus]|uniref:caspase 20, apoptosis-related cysteine peptidase n=1 Tax=Clarias gariepinus TaxID=13013 RepID=UPI00234DFC5D|nr:caspase 20, apoptosis-related cysteine peptidase [Clarias gariepinus]